MSGFSLLGILNCVAALFMLRSFDKNGAVTNEMLLTIVISFSSGMLLIAIGGVITLLRDIRSRL